MEGDCNVYALFAVNAPIRKMIYSFGFHKLPSMYMFAHVFFFKLGGIA